MGGAGGMGVSTGAYDTKGVGSLCRGVGRLRI